MGCGCGNAGRNATGNAYHPATAGFQAPAQEWVVSYPDGRSVPFSDEAEAYREVRIHGGGIRQQAKSA